MLEKNEFDYLSNRINDHEENLMDIRVGLASITNKNSILYQKVNNLEILLNSLAITISKLSQEVYGNGNN